jgi:hypothetical protein
MSRKTKLQPAALALLREKNKALENEFSGQIAQRILAGLRPWPHLGKNARPVPQYAFHPKRKWRYDYAWPNHRLLIDIDGGTYSSGAHARGGGIENDREKDAAAVVAGWRVLRVTAKQVKAQRAVAWVEEILAREVNGEK